jgi:hypothetical protein
MLSKSPATVDDGNGGENDESALALSLSTTAAAAADDDGCAVGMPRLFFALPPPAASCCRAADDSDRDRFDCGFASGLAVLPVVAVEVVEGVVEVALLAVVALRR